MNARALGVGLLEALFPPPCGGCEDVGREPFCRICTEALLPAQPFEIEGAEAALACWAYGGPVARALRDLKYEGRWPLGRALGAQMQLMLPQLPTVDVIVPVPLAPAALVARGYNQARELARGISRPILPRALLRRPGATQVGLTRQERLMNLRDAFEPGPEAVKDRSVLLVDDVVTTGATAEAACKILAAAGANRVVVLAAAHTSSEPGT